MLNFVQAGLSLAGGFLGKKSAKKAARNKARAIRQMAKYNAAVKKMEEKSVLQTMGAETSRSYKTKRRQMASQRAAFSKTGAVSKGTPMTVMLEQALDMESDIQNQRRNRLLQAQNLRQQGKAIKYQGEMQAQTAIEEGRAAGRASLLSGFTGAVGSIGAGLSASKAKGDTAGQFSNFSLLN